MTLWSSLMAWLGFQQSGAPGIQGGSVVRQESIWDQYVRVSGGLTPAQVTSVVRAADMGQPRDLIDLVNAIRAKDGHIHACLTTVELDIASLEWTAIAQGGKPGKTSRNDRKLADQVQAAIEQINGWHEAKSHLVGSGEINGHGTIDLNWGMYAGQNKLLKGWLVPMEAEVIASHRFGFRGSDGELLFDAEGTGDVSIGGVDLLGTLPAGKIIQHRPRVNGDVAHREGIARLLAWLGMFRNWTLRDYLLAAELSWKPTRIIKYAKGGSSEDIALANELANRMTPSGGAAIPDTLSLELGFAKNAAAGAANQHRDLLEWLGQEISKATLGHTLLLEAGTKGARSLGEVGYKMAGSRRDARAIALAHTINAQLVLPLVRYNAAGKHPPLYLPDCKGSVDIDQFSRGVDTLAKRMKIPASWVRESARIPEPQGDEEILDMGYQPDGIQATEEGELEVPITVEGEDADQDVDEETPAAPDGAQDD